MTAPFQVTADADGKVVIYHPDPDWTFELSPEDAEALRDAVDSALRIASMVRRKV